jgi:hypothetical protein
VPSDVPQPSGDGNGFRLCQLAAAALERADREVKTTARRPAARARNPDLAWARGLLAAIEERMADGDRNLGGLIPAVQAEIAVAAAESEADATSSEEECDPLFRLRIARWALAKDDLAELLCVRDPRLRVLTFDFDVTELMSVRNADDLATPPASRRSYLVAFGRSDGGRRSPLAVDRATARILTLSDGMRSASEIIGELDREGLLSGEGIGFKWIEYLFAHGLVLLRDRSLDAARGIRSAPDVDRDVSLQFATAIAVDSSSPSLSSPACDGG